MVEPHAVLQTANGDLGVAATIGLHIQGAAFPVGDEGVVAVVEKRISCEPGVGFTLRTMRRTGTASGSLPNGVYSVLATSAALPIHYGTGVHSAWGIGLDEMVHAWVLANGGGKADTLIGADGHNGVGVEPAVGPST